MWSLEILKLRPHFRIQQEGKVEKESVCTACRPVRPSFREPPSCPDDINTDPIPNLLRGLCKLNKVGLPAAKKRAQQKTCQRVTVASDDQINNS